MNAQTKEAISRELVGIKADPWNVPAAPVEKESTTILRMIDRLASAPNIPVERMEQLFDLFERIEARQAKTAFTSALSAMQPDLPTIDRKGRIVIHNKDDRNNKVANPRVEQSTPYALWEDINDAIRPHLAKHGFALSFRVGTASDGKLTVTGILSHREGHSEETTLPLMHDSSGSKNSVQAIGSAVSYGKRYTAMALLNITSRAPADADDDAKVACGPATIGEEQIGELVELIEQASADKAAFLGWLKIEKLADMPAARFEEARTRLRQKIAQKAARQ